MAGQARHRFVVRIPARPASDTNVLLPAWLFRYKKIRERPPEGPRHALPVSEPRDQHGVLVSKAEVTAQKVRPDRYRRRAKLGRGCSERHPLEAAPGIHPASRIILIGDNDEDRR